MQLIKKNVLGFLSVLNEVWESQFIIIYEEFNYKKNKGNHRISWILNVLF